MKVKALARVPVQANKPNDRQRHAIPRQRNDHDLAKERTPTL